VAALNGSVGRGFNLSVMFLMSMPFAVVGVIAAVLIYTYRRAQATPQEHHETTQSE
jgi:mannose/fructose/N-acetylgalactosamine-specific phosphotransferase system component IIC